MSIWNKNNLIRVYAFEKSYVLSSEINKDEKLQICTTDTSITLNQLSTEEWNYLNQSKTNSVSSPSAACVFSGYGCLGLLCTSIQQIQEIQQNYSQATDTSQHSSKRSPRDEDTFINPSNKLCHSSITSMQYFLIFVKEAESVGTIKQSEIMRITDVFILPLNVDPSFNNLNQQNYYQIQSLRSYIDDIRFETLKQ
jgi:hypothetical protein